MALFRPALTAILLALSGQLTAAPCNEAARHHIIQQVCNGNDRQAVALYKRHCTSPDYSLLREIGFAILERDAKACDPTVQRLGLFGISLTADEHAIAFFHEALGSPQPEIQLYALQQLCRYHDAGAEAALRSAMSSPYPLMRFEAAFMLAQGKFNCALSQVESLMHKCPDVLLCIFPEILVEMGSEGAFQLLRKLLMNPSQLVRLAAVQAMAKRPIERYAPYVRTLASQNDPVQLEACCLTLGALKDHQAVPLLVRASSCGTVETQLAASLALYRLGYTAYKDKIIQTALTGNLFAIQLLALFDNQEELLLKIYRAGDSGVKANAAIALLETRDRRAPLLMLDYLSPSMPQPPLVKIYSHGRSLTAFKGTPLGAYDTPLWETACELALLQREKWLGDCYGCGEEPFLELADKLISRRQNDLVPALFHLLEGSYSEATEKFLEKCAQMPGYPLVRNYALIALLQKGERDTCYPALRDWIRQQWQSDLFSFRPSISHLDSIDNDFIPSDLKPNETAKLFLDALSALVADQSQESVALALEGLENSASSLHPIFAALLIRLVQ